MRDEEQNHALDEEEYQARGDFVEAQAIHHIGSLNLHGPPWYDEYTHEQLPDEEVNEAMQNERNSLESFKMSRPADESGKNVPGTEIVNCRWLLHRKKSTKKVKARLIAQQIKWPRLHFLRALLAM